MLPTHAMQRALERCPGVCPGLLIRQIKRAVLDRDERFVKFVARTRKETFVDLYFFKIAGGLPRYALVTTPTGFIVTFLEPGSAIWTSRGRFLLGENGLEAISNDQSDELRSHA